MATAERTPDVLVVGAGVVGLGIAWVLARQGLQVTVLDRAAPGAGASQAAAGMLAAQVEAGKPDGFFRLACLSRDLWASWAEALREEGTTDVEYVQGGILEVATTETQAAHLRALAEEQQAAGQDAEWLEAREVERLLPGCQGVLGALLCPRDGQVNPGRVVAALVAACRRRGVTLRTAEPAVEILDRLDGGNRVVGVRTPKGILHAEVTILATGAWTGELAGLPVVPWKGQIVAASPPLGVSGPWLESGMCVYGPGIYLVPRRSGRLLLGATMEPEAGFDERPTLAAAQTLIGAAAAFLPGLRSATFDTIWAGLRPGSPDGRPLMGWLKPGLLVAAGHGRNGILLAPITAQIVTDLLNGRADLGDLTPLHLSRFATTP